MNLSNDPKDKTIKFRIQQDLYNSLEKASKKRNISISQMIRDSIIQYLTKLEK